MAISQATTADLQNRSIATLSPQQLTVGQVRLQDAFTQIIIQIPGASTRLDGGVVTDPFNQLVIQVQCAMVLRVLSNPGGTLEETIDDYTRRLDATVSTGALYLTDAELALLTEYDGNSDTAFTINPFNPWQSVASATSPGFTATTTPDWWWPTGQVSPW